MAKQTNYFTCKIVSIALIIYNYMWECSQFMSTYGLSFLSSCMESFYASDNFLSNGCPTESHGHLMASQNQPCLMDCIVVQKSDNNCRMQSNSVMYVYHQAIIIIHTCT